MVDLGFWTSADPFPKSAAYGKCIVADYNNVQKDKCLQEFLKLKNCYQVG
jgi:hypothetical protein